MEKPGPIRFRNEKGSFTASQTPTSETVIHMIPKVPRYLGGETNRVACEPLYETEAREARDRRDLTDVRRVIAEEIKTAKQEKDERHNKNLHGERGVDGLTGFHHGTFYLRGVPQIPKK